MRKPSEPTTVWAVLGGGLLLRVVFAFAVFPGRGFDRDLEYFADWASAMARFGPSALYANEPSANYPPVYLLVLWPIGVATSWVAELLGRDPHAVGLVMAKVPAVSADLGIALLLFTTGRRWWTAKVGLGAAVLFLAVPVTWFDSAIWGQVDSVAALPVLGSLVLLADRRPAWALSCATAAVLLKPQSAVVLAVALVVLVRRHLIDRHELTVLVRSGLSAVGVLVVVCVPFDLDHFSGGRLRTLPVLGDLSGLWQLSRTVGNTFSVLTANAYNGWALVGPRPLADDPGGGTESWTADSLVINVPLLGSYSAFEVGAVLLASATLTVVVPLLLRPGLSEQPTVLLLGHVVLAAAFSCLPTRVHERYLYPVFVSGALLAVLAGRWLVMYAAASFTHAVNLHAVLSGPLNPGFDAAATRPGQTPLVGPSANPIALASHTVGTWSRSLPVAMSLSVLHSLLFLGLLGVWAVVVGQPHSSSGSEPWYSEGADPRSRRTTTHQALTHR